MVPINSLRTRALRGCTPKGPAIFLQYPQHKGLLCLLLVLCLLPANRACTEWKHSAQRAGKAGDRVVVLTFDDAVKSHRTFVAPLLKELGFGATFFVTHRWMADAATS